jgi:hypothetical protein
MKLKVPPTKAQLAELKQLADALDKAREASALKKRLASFRDDNADVLGGDGMEIGGVNVRVKTTHELIVEKV